MKFKDRNLRALAECLIGDNTTFLYHSSSRITEFFQDCDIEVIHDGSTRSAWTVLRLEELLNEPQPKAHTLPERFVHVLRTLMLKEDTMDDDPGRSKALEELNKPLMREGYEAFYGDDNLLYIRHIGTKTVSVSNNPHRPLTPHEIKTQNITDRVSRYLL
ncbi:TPA: hypothetical protein PC598_002653 [Morganella morganii]|nr:hypothetical protein [Morganella morganii]